MGNTEDLKALEELENKAKNIDEKVNIVEGFKKIDKFDLPQEGLLYPENWEFAYRCPTALEIANFSTINEQDQPGIILAIEDLIRKCVVIYDTTKEQRVSAGEINDCHRTFFLLLLRDFYLPGDPIKINGVCTSDQELNDVFIKHESLKYSELSEKLIESFDGRKFSLNMDGETIEFLIPTIELSGRIFKYIVRAYKEQDKKEDKIAYDKQFLLFAPYLFEKGDEPIKTLFKKFKDLKSDNKRFKAYLEIINRLKLDNLTTIDFCCSKCGSLEETQLRFPGGWKEFFINKTDTTGYFD